MSAAGTADKATAGGDPTGQRVTPLELFFDLVFVFALTQVTGVGGVVSKRVREELLASGRASLTDHSFEDALR